MKKNEDRESLHNLFFSLFVWLIKKITKIQFCGYPNLTHFNIKLGEWKRASSCTQTSLSPKEQISSVNGTTSIIKQPVIFVLVLK